MQKTFAFSKAREEDNCYRFYQVSLQPDLLEDASIQVCWGRIGRPARVRIAKSGSVEEMEKEIHSMKKERLRKGYEEILY